MPYFYVCGYQGEQNALPVCDRALQLVWQSDISMHN